MKRRREGDRPRMHAARLLEIAVAISLTTSVLAGCGAKTGLEVPEFDASFDASVPPDATIVDAFVPPIDAALPPPDVCIELPPMEPPRFVEVSFVSRISTAEIYFLVDVTGSMGSELMQIQSRLDDTIVPGIVAEIPDVRFSVGRFADYPVSPYGSTSPRDDLYRLEQASTTDVGAVQRAVDRLMANGGNDAPEGTVEALYVSATGDVPPGIVPPRSCPSGTVGYPCFRPEGSRIFLLFSDAAFHDGPEGAEPYGADLRFQHWSYDETVAALRDIGATVLGLYSGEVAGDGGEALMHMQRIARDTGAVRPDGTPIVFDIGSSGERLGSDVVEAVRTLVRDVLLDVDAVVEDYPGDTFDATEFVTGIVAVSADPPSGATRLADRFQDVHPGTTVTFRVNLANETIPRLDVPQRYRMTVVLRGNGVTRLKETVVDVVIPALDGTGCDEILPGGG